MANMQLGNYTFAINPAEADLPLQRRMGLPVETLGGAEMFSWGITIVGSKIKLHWEFMPTSMFTSIENLFIADAQVVFDPTNGHTYNVEIMNLLGAYHIDPTNTAPYRKNVELELYIISQAT